MIPTELQEKALQKYRNGARYIFLGVDRGSGRTTAAAMLAAEHASKHSNAIILVFVRKNLQDPYRKAVSPHLTGINYRPLLKFINPQGPVEQVLGWHGNVLIIYDVPFGELSSEMREALCAYREAVVIEAGYA